MATRKTGPVKPPTLDLQARKTTSTRAKGQTARNKTGSTRAKPATADLDKNTPSSTSQKSAGAKKATNPAHATGAETTKQTARAAQTNISPVVAAAIGVGGGAVLGVILTVGLLASGLLQPLFPRPVDPRIDELNTRIGISEEQVTEGLVGFNALNDQVSGLRLSTEQAISALSDQTDAAQGELQDRLRALSASQTELESKIEQLANSPAPAPATSFDPSALEAQISALNTRLDAIAAGASTDDAQKLAADLDALRVKVETFAGLQTRLNTLEAQFSATQITASDAQQIALQADALAKTNADDLSRLASLVETQAATAPSTPDALPSTQIPLALMGLDAALAGGRPFETELQLLTSLVPDLSVSPSLSDFATKGLPPPDRLADEFGAAMPALLAARPISPDAGWQENLWARLKSLLALRPTSENGAEGVDATIARLENALRQRDFAAANDAIEALPDPMRQTLGTFVPQLKALQELQTLRASVTNSALTAGSTSEAPQ